MAYIVLWSPTLLPERSCSHGLRSEPPSAEVVPAGQSLDRLAFTSEDDIAFGNLPDHREGHFDTLCQCVQRSFRGTDQELVILAPCGRKDLGVAPERSSELAGVVFDGQEIQVHHAPHPAAAAHAAYVRSQAVGEVYHGGGAESGSNAPGLEPRFWPQAPADEAFRA